MAINSGWGFAQTLGLCIFVIAACLAALRWLVSIPVNQAVTERTLRRADDPRIRLGLHANIDANGDANSDASRVGPAAAAQKCLGMGTRFVNAFEGQAGTWSGVRRRADSQEACELMCAEDPVCAAYAHSAPACTLVQQGSNKVSDYGTTHWRGSVHKWGACA